jgi:fibronectin type III domain protein
VTSADGVTETPAKRGWRSRGGLVTIGTVLSLVTGLGLTVLGLGAADQAVASFDAASWVWSRGKGEMARINGVTAKVDTRVDVPAGRGHEMQVSQTDHLVILRDINTGVISSMDLSTLQVYQRNATMSSGIGVRVALDDDAAFVIDSVQGLVQQLDPRTLAPVGQPLRFPPGITGGVFDGKGRLWIAVPSEGTVSAISPAPLPSGDADGGQAAGAAAGPRTVRTKDVAPPSHELTISTLDNGVAVLNRTTNALTTIAGDDAPSVTTLPLAGPGSLASRTDGLAVPVTVPDSRHVYVVSGGAMRDDFQVPGDGVNVQPAVAWEGFFYVADDDTGVVHVFDSAGREQKSIAFDRPGGPLELDVRENYLFINAPGSSTARVVDNAHTVRVVDKYADDILGGDPPAVPPTPPNPPKPPKPVVSKPGPPRNVRAAAGNTEARVTWQSANPNGAPITRYVVTGAGRTFQVGANQRSLEVTGLTNGETYRFDVHAVNKKGDGPARTSNPVKPTSEVPDPPGAPNAEARPNGTVVVNWPAANGQGLKIDKYTVTAVSDGASAPVGNADGTSMTIKAGELEYGTQYAFTVVAINEHGAGSKSSPISGTVVPFTKPGRPEDVNATTVGNQAGAIQVTWAAPADNGRTITKYVVSGGGKSTEAQAGSTSATLNGFGDGVSVSVSVTAVNEAGASEAGTATAKTVNKPVITMTGGSATFNTATVTFSVNAGGGTATCSVKASPGGASASGSCTSLTAKSLKPSTKYTLTVTAKNAAGTVTKAATQTTDKLLGTATCNDVKNSSDPDVRVYCDKERPNERNGNEIFSVTRQDNDKQVGWVKSGTKLQAFCKKTGENVDPYVYNSHSASSWWIQVSYKSKKPYIPYAWFFLDGGDNLNDLPTC